MARIPEQRPDFTGLKVAIRDYHCISCHKMNLRVRNHAQTQAEAENDADENPLIQSSGWRKTPDGWMCPGCTGIDGVLGKAIRTADLKPGHDLRVVFEKDGSLDSVKSVKRRRNK